MADSTALAAVVDEAVRASGGSMRASGLAKAWRLAGEWVARQDRALRRFRGIPDVGGRVRLVLLCLILFSTKAIGRDHRAFVYALTYGIQGDVDDPEVVDSEGTVSGNSLLYAVVDELRRQEARANEAGAALAGDTLTQLLVGTLELPAAERDQVWEALRAVTRPQVAPRVDSSGTQ